MNPQQYTTYQQKYPDFDQKYVHDIPINDIEISPISDQVRTAGEDKLHILELADQIEHVGQLTPATGRRLLDGRVELHAGVHRFCAVRHNQKTMKESRTLRVAMNFSEINFNSRTEEVLWQLNENTEPANKNCDTEDYVQALTGLIIKEHILGTDLEAITDKILRAYIRKEIPNLTAYKINKITNNILNNALFSGQHKYRNYATKLEAAAAFTEINPWGLVIDKSGECDKGVTVYFAESLTAIAQNNLHGAWHVKARQEDSQVLLVVYCGNVRVKTRDLEKWRRDAMVKFKTENSHPLFTGDIFDGIVFLPQLLMGNKVENQQILLDPLKFQRNETSEEVIGRVLGLEPLPIGV